VTDAPARGRRLVPLSTMRAAIARRMTESKQQAPHFYVSADIPLDGLLDALASINVGRDRARRVTVTAAVMRALTDVLRDEPMFNARWTADGLEVADEVNIGVAIPVDDGLLAPAILDTDRLDLDGLARALADLTQRARSGRLRGRELSEGTFTLSNLGMHDVSAFAAIIVPPQVAILALGRAAPRPWVVDGEIVSRRVMTATLSADHRAVDGVAGARFLGRLHERLLAAPQWIAQEPAASEAS